MNGYPRFGWVDILRFQQRDRLKIKRNEDYEAFLAIYLYKQKMTRPLEYHSEVLVGLSAAKNMNTQAIMLLLQ